MPSALETPVISSSSLSEGDLKTYREKGFLLLPKFVHQDHLCAMNEEVLDVLMANGCTREKLYQGEGAQGKLIQSLQYLKGGKLDELINSSETLEVASQLIGGPAIRYMPFTAVKCAGGGGPFHLHQDNNYTQHEPALGSLNIWVALVDMTLDNGCLVVVPGSHDRQWVSRPSDDGDNHQQIDVPDEQRVPVKMKAGDAVAFTRWTVHGSGPTPQKNRESLMRCNTIVRT